MSNKSMFTGSVSRSMAISVASVVVSRSQMCMTPVSSFLKTCCVTYHMTQTKHPVHQPATMSTGQFQACPFRANSWLTATLNR